MLKPYTQEFRDDVVAVARHGEAIHAWVFEEPRSAVDEVVLAHSFEKIGAVVMGRRLYDIVDGPNG